MHHQHSTQYNTIQHQHSTNNTNTQHKHSTNNNQVQTKLQLYSLGRLQVGEELPRQLRQKPPPDEVVLLYEYLPQPGLAARVVLEVELVEAVEGVLVGVDVQQVDVEVVARQVEGLEDLREGEVLAVPIFMIVVVVLISVFVFVVVFM